MNRERAKEILSAYRAGSDDENDPTFNEALLLAQADNELRTWLQERQAFDEAVCRRLENGCDLPLPATELIARARRRYTLHRRRALVLAIAACLVACITVAAYWLSRLNSRPTTQFALCRRDLAQFLNRFPRLELETENLAEARRWLAQTHHLQQIQLPAGLERFPTIGCRSLRWQNRNLALVCFVVDGEIVHLILIPRSAIPDGPPDTKPQFAREAGTSSVAWSQGDLTYLVLSKASEDFLRTRL